MKNSLLIALTLFLSACSVDLGPLHLGADKDGVHANSDKKSLSYNLTENGCSTGEKTFSNEDELCAGLRDDAFNQYCARGLRYEQFKQNCSGKTWSERPRL